MSDLLQYEFAGVPVGVYPYGDAIPAYCRGYETEKPPLFCLRIGKDDIAAERALSGTRSDTEAELLAFYRLFCDTAARYDVFLMHASAVALDRRAYLFCAPSGTGKSTHTRYWREVFGDRTVMINDDKPLLRLENGAFRVYGTPWNGKHRLSANISAPLAGIAFLSRGEENRVAPLCADEALPRLYAQTYRPRAAEDVARVTRNLILLSGRIPLYALRCNMSSDAARVAAAGMGAVSDPFQ